MFFQFQGVLWSIYSVSLNHGSSSPASTATVISQLFHLCRLVLLVTIISPSAKEKREKDIDKERPHLFQNPTNIIAVRKLLKSKQVQKCLVTICSLKILSTNKLESRSCFNFLIGVHLLSEHCCVKSAKCKWLLPWADWVTKLVCMPIPHSFPYKYQGLWPISMCCIFSSSPSVFNHKKKKNRLQ